MRCGLRPLKALCEGHTAVNGICPHNAEKHIAQQYHKETSLYPVIKQSSARGQFASSTLQCLLPLQAQPGCTPLYQPEKKHDSLDSREDQHGHHLGIVLKETTIRLRVRTEQIQCQRGKRQYQYPWCQQWEITRRGKEQTEIDEMVILQYMLLEYVKRMQ